VAVSVRAARPEELEQIVALEVDRNGEECDGPVQELFARDGVSFTVAVDGDRVVSSLCLIPETLQVGGAQIRAGEIGYVATANDYEKRGLVRAQMDLVHEWSQERGHLAQIIGGIPYFYRQFGYEYAVAFPGVRLLNPGVHLSIPDGWSVRPAVEADAEAVLALQTAELRRVGVSRVRDAWPMASGLRVAVRDGSVHGAGEYAPGPPGVPFDVVRSVAFDVREALFALLAGAPTPVAVLERPSASALMAGISHAHPYRYGLYVRAPDPVAILGALRPVLTERLRAAPAFAAYDGHVTLSLYTTSIVIGIASGSVVQITAAPGEQNPRHIGVPPDLFATLIFGRYGAAGLEARHDDVSLGRFAGLAEVLFPRLDADVSLP
jgi:predicted N-acetyltransferase YhbS